MEEMRESRRRDLRSLKNVGQSSLVAVWEEVSPLLEEIVLDDVVAVEALRSGFSRMVDALKNTLALVTEEYEDPRSLIESDPF